MESNDRSRAAGDNWVAVSHKLRGSRIKTQVIYAVFSVCALSFLDRKVWQSFQWEDTAIAGKSPEDQERHTYQV